ncbi:5-oxoprolinase subunit B family protein [Pseudarthrobacter sp. J1738]|uniref:5-oxoprolinase subunit B family protein n=1 Tax=Pseudarthrobacter sp. J1738 TaxID=3420446 RepID=UPI003D2B381B
MSAGYQVLPYGDCAVLVELGSLDAVLELSMLLSGGDSLGTATARPAEVREVIPAARTILISFLPGPGVESRIRDWVAAAITTGTRGARVGKDAGASDGAVRSGPRAVTLEVSYNGADLAEVAGLLGRTEAEVVRLHTESTWRAAFAGFAPGFMYLVTNHALLTVPRRTSPRTSVEPGSVGLAGEFSGAYPRSSPGGWQLLGTTTARLWDAKSPAPALIQPGDTVRFVRVP